MVVTPQLRADIVARCRQREKLIVIAAEAGVSASRISQIACAAGLRRRPPRRPAGMVDLAAAMAAVLIDVIGLRVVDAARVLKTSDAQVCIWRRTRPHLFNPTPCQNRSTPPRSV